ncbi:helix-turn-helix transcriptional regulator [Baia soyae]|uniref:Putative ArsR family transcriptional regulator n=1 Tax=Baia soyae TaxID=1544746 RepID=A0A4R2S3R6_9BACL|nr:metalloregulator ArsR/SmtB family transcription factor [Baia soyae]TCP70684.1 putative ArsR family transcriptional regulator [Baia soyae]
MSEPMSYTRQQILTLLRKSGSMSAQELANALEISNIAVRKHLQVLEKDHLLKTTLVRQAMGRPTSVYSLTEEAEAFFPKHYSDLTLDFLQDLESLHGKETIDQLFRLREERLKETIRPLMKDLPLSEQVAQLASIQQEKGYMAEWEEGVEKGTYTMTEYNCPIHTVAHQYLQACGSELSLFRGILDADVEQVECKAKGGKQCIYQIRPHK